MALPARVVNLAAAQGGTPDEDAMLNGALLHYQPHGTANAGVNSVFAVGLDGVAVACFHKTFAGVDAAIANRYNQSPDTAPIHECAAWLLAKALGWPYNSLVPPCVYRELNGEPGSLARGITGAPMDFTPLAAGHPQGMAAAFFDCLIAQQDRHMRNYRWEPAAAQLHLIDHGFAFAAPGDFCNSSTFVEVRHNSGLAALSAGELASLQLLLNSPDLFGLAGILEPARAARLRDRAQELWNLGTLLPLGAF